MKDYYRLLGISRDVSQHNIKQAYREVAKQCHPDISNVETSTSQFQAIVEAYEILSDGVKRRRYDQLLCEAETCIPISVSSQPAATCHSLTSQHPKFKIRRCNDSSPFDKNNSQPLFQTDGKTVYCEIDLSREATKEDVICPLNLEIYQRCSRCYGSMLEFIYLCPECFGTRYVCKEKQLEVIVPQGIEHGTCRKLSLDHVGLPGVALQVRILVT